MSRLKPHEGGPSFSLRHRLYRLAWNVTWFLLAAWTPPPLHRWRVFILQIFGADVHSSARIYGSTKIWYPAYLTMQEHSTLGPHVNCYNMAPITLRAGAIVSQGAYLCAGTHDINSPEFTLYALPIEIGPDAWVAAEAFIGPGVSIGEGTVVGARAVVFSAAEAWAVYAGNPAKKLKQRVVARSEAT